MAKLAFDHCVGDYARYRPPYPAAVFDVLAHETATLHRRLVADVGAGTGISTRALAGRGWRVIAVEPSLAMLKQVTTGPPATTTVAGEGIAPLCATAEATSLADQSVGLVTAAQAFHWFNPPVALAEFARILRPGGVLGLIWNNRDGQRSDFVNDYDALIARYNPAYRREYRQQDWPAKVAASGRFGPARYDCFDHEWRLSHEAFVGFSRSVSYIRNVLSREDRPRFEADLRSLMHQHFGDGECVVPQRTDLWTTRLK